MICLLYTSGQCQTGSLTGAVASERVSEAPKGSLRMDGNHSKSAKAAGRLTETPTGGAGTKVGLSDPVVLSGNAIAQRIKATLGITGLSRVFGPGAAQEGFSGSMGVKIPPPSLLRPESRINQGFFAL